MSFAITESANQINNHLTVPRTIGLGQNLLRQGFGGPNGGVN